MFSVLCSCRCLCPVFLFVGFSRVCVCVGVVFGLAIELLICVDCLSRCSCSGRCCVRV